MTPLMIARAIIPATIHVSSSRLWLTIPSSTASRSRNGEATLRIEPRDDQGEQGPETYFVWNEQAPDPAQRDGTVGFVLRRTGCFSERGLHRVRGRGEWLRTHAADFRSCAHARCVSRAAGHLQDRLQG